MVDIATCLVAHVYVRSFTNNVVRTRLMISHGITEAFTRQSNSQVTYDPYL